MAVEAVNGTWRGLDVHHINHQDRVTFLQKRGHIDPGGPGIVEADSVRKVIMLFQVMDGMDTKTFV